MELRVTSQEASASLDSLLDRVRAGATVVIERDGRAVGRITAATDVEPVRTDAGSKRVATVADLVEFLRAWQPLDDGWAEGVEEAVRAGNDPSGWEDPWDR